MPRKTSTNRLSRAERDAINARADEQGRTVEYIFERRDGILKKDLVLTRAVIRDQAWVLANFKGAR